MIGSDRIRAFAANKLGRTTKILLKYIPTCTHFLLAHRIRGLNMFIPYVGSYSYSTVLKSEDDGVIEAQYVIAILRR